MAATIHILSMSKDRQLLQQIEPSSVKEELIKVLTNILVTTRSNASTINAETSVDMERAIANAVMQLVNFKLYTGRFVRTVEEQLNWNNSQFDGVKLNYFEQRFKEKRTKGMYRQLMLYGHIQYVYIMIIGRPTPRHQHLVTNT